MTQTIDRRARELLANAMDAEFHRPMRSKEIREGWRLEIAEECAIAALTEALTRIEELEGALGFYASVVRYQGPNQRAMPDDKWTDDDAVYRLDVTRDGGAIARATLTQGIKE